MSYHQDLLAWTSLLTCMQRGRAWWWRGSSSFPPHPRLRFWATRFRWRYPSTYLVVCPAVWSWACILCRVTVGGTVKESTDWNCFSAKHFLWCLQYTGLREVCVLSLGFCSSCLEPMPRSCTTSLGCYLACSCTVPPLAWQPTTWPSIQPQHSQAAQGLQVQWINFLPDQKGKETSHLDALGAELPLGAQIGDIHPDRSGFEVHSSVPGVWSGRVIWSAPKALGRWVV